MITHTITIEQVETGTQPRWLYDFSIDGNPLLVSVDNYYHTGVDDFGPYVAQSIIQNNPGLLR